MAGFRPLIISAVDRDLKKISLNLVRLQDYYNILLYVLYINNSDEL